MLLAMVILTALSAFFSATETAFTSFNRIRMKSLASAGNKRAAKVIKLDENYDKLITTILIFGSAFLFWLLEREALFADLSPMGKVWAALFSSVTARTAGFNTVDTGALSNGSKLLTMVLMLIGGSPGSTAGGIKINRLILAAKMMLVRLKLQQHPNAIIRIRLDGIVQENEMLHSVMIFIVAYMICIFLGSIVGALFGVDLMSSFSGAVASMGNVGPGFGEIGSMDNFSSMPATFKYTNSFLMLLGRLEIFGLIQLFFIKWWR